MVPTTLARALRVVGIVRSARLTVKNVPGAAPMTVKLGTVFRSPLPRHAGGKQLRARLRLLSNPPSPSATKRAVTWHDPGAPPEPTLQHALVRCAVFVRRSALWLGGGCSHEHGLRINRLQTHAHQNWHGAPTVCPAKVAHPLPSGVTGASASAPAADRGAPPRPAAPPAVLLTHVTGVLRTLVLEHRDNHKPSWF